VSLRLRLAVFIALAIALALLAQGLLGYVSFQRSLYATLDRDLEGYVRALLGELRFDRGSFGARPARLPEGYVAAARLLQGQSVLREWGDFPAELPLPTPGLRSETRTVGAWRVGTLELGGGFYLQAAIQSQQVTRSLQNYRDTVLLTALVVALAGAVVAWLLSGPCSTSSRPPPRSPAPATSAGGFPRRAPASWGGSARPSTA
jgi:hypothetical protein